VQLVAFLFIVYGSVVVGFYTADKVSGAFPVLSCAYDARTADYCALIPLQHQMAHRIGSAVASGGAELLAISVATLVTLGTFLALFVLLNKAFCGWLCPVGFFQELMGMVGQKLGVRRLESVPEGTVKRVRPVKWLLLAGLVFIIPLLAGMGLFSHDFGSPYCSICPSRILTTVANGDLGQVFVDTSSGGALLLSVIGTFLFGLMAALAMRLRQPFCRICPMLAMHAAVRKLGFARLVKEAKPRCEKCGLCAKACPMDIREVATEMKKKDVTFADCTLCGRCVEFCPDKDVLAIKYLGFRLFRADPNYFKRRKQAQTAWEKGVWFRGSSTAKPAPEAE
jgi:formate hydrogenlyase subunit 6/NADH:ubiquinone oxidoreductase subunit I